MTRLFGIRTCISVEQPANVRARTLPDGFGQGRDANPAAQADRLTKAFDERRATRASGAVPLDRGAFDALELAIGERR